MFILHFEQYTGDINTTYDALGGHCTHFSEWIIANYQ